MKYKTLIVTLFLFISIVSLAQVDIKTQKAKEYYTNEITSKSKGLMKLIKFSKQDGYERVFDGVNIFVMEWKLEYVTTQEMFVNNKRFDNSNQLKKDISIIEEIKFNEDMKVLFDFALFSFGDSTTATNKIKSGYYLLKPGSKFELTGDCYIQKTENSYRIVQNHPHEYHSISLLIDSVFNKLIVKSVTNVDPELVFVEGGTYQMGSNDVGNWEKPLHEGPIHTVKINDFYMGKYEVTQAEYLSLMGRNPSFNRNCSECPVENVNWYDAQSFISKLNSGSSHKYRLPTEAEWEYAARGGNQSHNYTYAGSNNIDDVGLYGGKSGYMTQIVGKKRANELGIFDMSGNVREWCNDWFDNYDSIPSSNPQGPASGGGYRVLRGGSWNDDPIGCRVTHRYGVMPNSTGNNFGFRLVCSKGTTTNITPIVKQENKEISNVNNDNYNQRNGLVYRCLSNNFQDGTLYLEVEKPLILDDAGYKDIIENEFLNVLLKCSMLNKTNDTFTVQNKGAFILKSTITTRYSVPGTIDGKDMVFGYMKIDLIFIDKKTNTQIDRYKKEFTGKYSNYGFNDKKEALQSITTDEKLKKYITNFIEKNFVPYK